MGIIRLNNIQTGGRIAVHAIGRRKRGVSQIAAPIHIFYTILQQPGLRMIFQIL